MKDYLMYMHGGRTSSVHWEYAFSRPSDQMALEYAEGLIRNDQAAQQAESIYLFNKSDDIFLTRFHFGPRSLNQSKD
jgi:hypothetical protein